MAILKPIFLDIETVPNERHVSFLDPIKVPKTYKKEEAIDAYVAKKKVERYDKMALDIDHAQIVAVGYAVGFEHDPRCIIARSYEEEEELLKFIWQLLRTTDNQIVGWNVRSFDIPILIRRAWWYDIKVHARRHIDPNQRYSNEIIDLMERMYHYGYSPGVKWRSLDKVCAMYQIPNKYPALDGSYVKDMTDAELREYSKNDIRMTRQLAVATKNYYW